MNLNIIGNGFDLFHGLPSSYYYFGCFLINENPSLYMELAKWFGFRFASEIRGYPEEDFEYGVEEQFWSDFEQSLGIVDESVIIDTYDSNLGLEIEDYDIPMDDYEVANQLRYYFIKWVTKTLDKESNYKIIKQYMNGIIHKRKYLNDFLNTDKYLVFNYTHVLQNLYNIERFNILYIHGECTGSEYDNLIFGHGNKKRILEIENIINQYNNRALYQSERTNLHEYECLKSFMQLLEKDVNTNLMGADRFYNHFPGIPERINVYGMSLGMIDYPYFKQIRDRWPNVPWRFSYYSDLDKTHIDVIAQKLKLPKTMYSKFIFSNLKSKQIMDEIIKSIGIEIYPLAV